MLCQCYVNVMFCKGDGLTWICGQVLKVHGFADFSIRRPAQLHFHTHGFCQVGVAVRRRPEHNGHLPVNVGLGEQSFTLPRVLEKPHLDVL